MVRMLHTPSFRLGAVMLAVVLLLTFTAPAKAEAIDVTTALAIAGAALLVIILITYLVIANVEGKRVSLPDLPMFAMLGQMEGPWRLADEPVVAPAVVGRPGESI